MTCKSIISTFHSFLNAQNSPKENSGASGGFLPRPLLLRLRHPNSEKNQPRFCQILPPENSFGKTSSALVPPPARILGGQNTKEKCPFLFQKKFHPRQIRKTRNIFSLVSAVLGGWRGWFIRYRDWFQNMFELCIIDTAKIGNRNPKQKYGRREAPSVLHSPQKILNLKGFATLRVAPRLPIQNYE